MNTEPVPAKSEDRHTPAVSVVLLAYNHLSYTKLCVESLFQYTSHIDFELITVNNGSTDGTEEFFNSLPNSKKISFPENVGVDKAVNCGFRIAQGKYTLNLSNDIVVTAHWLDNLIACMESDEKIGMVVPVCSASSNGQQVDLPYQSIPEMQRMAQAYNMSNPCLWEEKMKLVTYTCLFRTSLQKELGGFDEDFNPGAYDDDAISFRIRRAGYKLILAKDTFVHHFGSVTFNAEYAKNNLAQRNLNLFISKFGVHPWQAAFIDGTLLTVLNYDGGSGKNILGIGMSCGATLLQIKNLLKEKGAADIKLYYLSGREDNMADLSSICEYCTHADMDALVPLFGSRTYDIIVLESEMDQIGDLEGLAGDLKGILKDGGQIVCTAPAEELHERIRTLFGSLGMAEIKSARGYYYCFLNQKTEV
ncbi:glycosyltransferase family 2 protein [Caproiciproducens sp. CPB-2]|uniref:glycosyltransferase family 2 protein n=1 Tax=Caproiciproducens sp. CPB-2 TaxID=3030017 RepID=UPI0023D989B0|nr:glycosyltransferase [Caproiciproducens sp. CPB-2]MDF1493885.1 glycosyltransferase [Caproiciproducens sp. CPB-2]